MNDDTIGLEVVTLGCGLAGGNTHLSYIPQTVAIFITHITDDEISYNSLKFLEELNGKLPVVHVSYVYNNNNSFVVVVVVVDFVGGNTHLSYIPQKVTIFIAHINDDEISYNSLKILEELNGKLPVVQVSYVYNNNKVLAPK